MARVPITLLPPPNGSMLRPMIGAVIYVRVSTKEQAENLSLPTQLRACAEYCRREGFDVLERFKEEGESAKTTACATSSGRLSRASGAGLYFSSRPSKKCVCIPPGISSVTPTCPASSVESARVKPTTPNLLAQYAVASLTARKPSVEATVTTRPWLSVK